MKCFEYRVEKIEFEDEKSNDEQLLELLNRLGEEGWQAISLGVEPRISIDGKGLRVLMERSVRKVKKKNR